MSLGLPIVVSVLLCATASLALLLEEWFASPILAGGVTLAAIVPMVFVALRRRLSAVSSMYRALAGTVSSYRDGDFSFGLAWPRNDELGDLVAAHNALGDTLREQRLGLVQRELLLDTMVQNTPVAMLLCTEDGRIVFANIVARKLLNAGRRLEGRLFSEILVEAPVAMQEVIARGGDGLFSVEGPDDEEAYYLARRQFALSGRRHELFVLRHMTDALRRQEVHTWKKVIRVISHELNNSLAPIASLAHSGAELLRLERLERLEETFATISDRARHLEGFIRGYATFAKLPAPRLARVDWRQFIARLRSHVVFRVEGEVPKVNACFDVAQLEQALINLLGNAHGSGSSSEEVVLRLHERAGSVTLEVLDRGSGMGETVLANALLPFYSTKRDGTGLGLALVREIAEAHRGRVACANREGGGLCVSVTLPLERPDALLTGSQLPSSATAEHEIPHGRMTVACNAKELLDPP